MAATTITRTGVTLTDDTGSAASPAGDGTLLNNAWVQTFMDRIDSLISANITFGGTLTAEGFGTHTLSAAGTGAQLLVVRNTSAGTGNYSGLSLGTDAANALVLRANSSTWTTSGIYVQNASLLVSTTAGGLDIATTAAGSEIRLWIESTEMATLNQYGRLELHRGFQLAGSYDQEITGTQALDSGGQHYAVIRLTACTSTPKISSCTAGNDGDIKIIVNVSGASCTVQHNGGGVGSRIYCANATDGTIADDESMMIMYDAGSSSWIEVGPR